MMYQLNWQFRKTKTGKIIWLAIFIAASAAIQAIENHVFPASLPFRPGLANIITLIIIAVFGISEALLAAAARSVLAALVSGKLLGVPFLLSLSGGLASALVMGLLYERFLELSVVGVSIIGAATHNVTQLLVIYFLLIHNQGIFRLIPWLWLMALLTGMIVGFIAMNTMKIPVLRNMSGRD